MKLIALALILASLPFAASAADYFESTYFATGYFETDYFETAAAGDVEVPDVVGQASFAAADAILEGDGLDGGPETEHCSLAADNEVTDQTPTAGTLVPLGTLVAIGTSNGVLCKGYPPLWLYLEIER